MDGYSFSLTLSTLVIYSSIHPRLFVSIMKYHYLSNNRYPRISFHKLDPFNHQSELLNFVWVYLKFCLRSIISNVSTKSSTNLHSDEGTYKLLDQLIFFLIPIGKHNSQFRWCRNSGRPRSLTRACTGWTRSPGNNLTERRRHRISGRDRTTRKLPASLLAKYVIEYLGTMVDCRCLMEMPSVHVCNYS